MRRRDCEHEEEEAAAGSREEERAIHFALSRREIHNVCQWPKVTRGADNSLDRRAGALDRREQMACGVLPPSSRRPCLITTHIQELHAVSIGSSNPLGNVAAVRDAGCLSA